MRAKKNPQYDEMFLGGLVDRAKGFAEKRPGLAKAIGLGGGMLLNKAIGNKGAGLFSKMSGAGLMGMLRNRRQQPEQVSAAADTRIDGARKTKPENATVMDLAQNIEVPQAEYGAMVKKYRTGGMIYGEDSAAVTLPDGSAAKEKKFVESPYGSGENRITEEDIKRNRSLNPFEEYGGYTIKGDDYGKTRQAVGFHPKKMDSPGYFLMEGYTDEQQMKNVEKGRPDATQQYVLEVNPDGSKRVIPASQIMDEFTTGAEGEGLADVLEAMNVGITRTDKGFTMPSREEQIRTLMNKRENYGLGDITFKALQKELGLVAPELQPGEYARILEKVLKDKEQGTRN